MTNLIPSNAEKGSIEARSSSRTLEIRSRTAHVSVRPESLLFVHGINVGAWVWEEHFLDYFAAAGFDSHAVSLRGHGQSWGRDLIDRWTLADYVDDLTQAIGSIGGPIILVGHSLGGAVVQKAVRSGVSAAGLALLASVPPWGLAPSALRLSARSPHALGALMQVSAGAVPPIDLELARQMLFDDGTSNDVIAKFLREVDFESPRIGAALLGWPPIAPLPFVAPRTFVLGGREDGIIPSDEVWRTGLYYGTRAEIIPRLGHMVMMGSMWESAADKLANWLELLN